MVVQKVGVYLVMLLFAAFVAGIYGALHNQISYTFSNEYFTQFKFIQFGIPWAYDIPRLGAAYIGVLATWWMGVLVFIILGMFGFIFSTPRQMARSLAQSFFVVTIVALMSGFVGLAYGYYQVNESSIGDYMQWVRPDVTDPIQFVRVGFMHSASYIGGLMGLLSGIAYLILLKRRDNRA